MRVIEYVDYNYGTKLYATIEDYLEYVKDQIELAIEANVDEVDLGELQISEMTEEEWAVIPEIEDEYLV